MRNFPLVCIGGSAGGLDAYIRVLTGLPKDLNVAVIIVNHITIVPTILHEVLARYTRMPVDLIQEGMPIRVNRVYIIPANRDLHIASGKFQLNPISKPRGWPDVITVFFQFVIENWGGKTVAVISSRSRFNGYLPNRHPPTQLQTKGHPNGYRDRYAQCPHFDCG